MFSIDPAIPLALFIAAFMSFGVGQIWLGARDVIRYFRKGSLDQ